MANRQDSGSDTAQQDQRPTPRNEEAVPEMTEDARGRAAEADDEDAFEDADDDLDEEEENDEGSF